MVGRSRGKAQTAMFVRGASCCESAFSWRLALPGPNAIHLLRVLVYVMNRSNTKALSQRDLGRRKNSCRFVSGYYPRLSYALIKSPRAVAGDKYAAPVERAWTDTFNINLKSMLGPGTKQAPAQA